ncbi:unnamed protein product [Rotaria sordida]|uniref:F-box domain-containing protein n=2 Tax=Rotaria sordida TaxID=392033 RepID=A0A819SN42_9BILA|nr:unnamed protein product [Rotaria sordida]
MMIEHSSIHLDNLPDEILLIIFNKLNNTTLLYSLLGVNKRLNKILYDSIFTNHLTLLRRKPNHLIMFQSLSSHLIYPLVDQILNRFCLEILPEIHDKIEWLDLESSSMERILLATNYPNLSGLGLYNIQAKRAIDLFSDETRFIDTLKKQIVSLIIDFDTNGKQTSTEYVYVSLFTHIFSTFTNLRSLKFGLSPIWCQLLVFSTPPSTVICSNLLELHVSLQRFIDCLYLVDGRFNQLHTLHVHIGVISSSRILINNKENLPNLRNFSLQSDMYTSEYDELIVPLLHRMINIEKLDLSLIVCVKKTFVDGYDLNINIVDHMRKLNRFTFNIRSESRFYNKFNLPLNGNIQNTFKDFKNNKIISCVDYFQDMNYSQCHIYSQPYKLKYYHKITNNFRGGLFKCVRKVELFDEHPFEHEFFLLIQKSFPLMENLTVINHKRQKNKQFRKLINENQEFSIIKYPHLIHLDFAQTSKDYHKQFLFDNKICLPNGVTVRMDYQIAKKVTRNFRRKTTRTNCAKFSRIFFSNKSTFPDHFQDYFPHAKIV